MTDLSASKAKLLKKLSEIWESDLFGISDGARAHKLRDDILKRVLSLIMIDDERARLFGLPKIRSGTFVGGPSVIYRGVTISDKVIVIPLSVVTKDVPNYSIVGGSPAKIIKKIDEAWIAKDKSRIGATVRNGG